MDSEAQQHKLPLLFSIITCLSFGLFSFISCTVAEVHRNKKKDMRINGGLCYLPGSPAFGFGIAALLCLCIAQIFGNSIYISQSFSMKKRDGHSFKRPAIAKALFFISWISFVVTVILLSAGTSMNRKQYYGEGWLHGRCYVVKGGIFIGSAVLALLTTTSIIGSAVITARKKQAMYKKLRLEPYAVHTTFQLEGTEGKRHRLREAMAFYDPPEYYDAPGGFLSFKLSIPKILLLDGDDNVESHFALINHQLKQIRTALAITSVLNRTLVMPPTWCRLESLWFPHPGILEGSLTRPPFISPLDHLLEVNSFLKGLSEEDFGSDIHMREYSFLDNPLLPKRALIYVIVRESWLDVQLCRGGNHSCFASNETSGLGVLKFPTKSSEETLKAVFSSLKDIKVIKFSSVQDAFLGFTDKTRERKFRNRVKRFASRWCCLQNKSPSHIYYDMFWDEKPGWKPVPPQTPHDDFPPW